MKAEVQVKTIRQKLLLVIFMLNLIIACGSATPRPLDVAPSATPTPYIPPGAPPGGFAPLDVPLDGQIVYSNGDNNIYVIEPRPDAKPKAILQMPKHKGDIGWPTWSADRQRIVYTYFFPANATDGLLTQDIWIANANGTNAQPLLTHQVNGEYFHTPVFSSDDRYVFYSRLKLTHEGTRVVGTTLTLERMDMQTKQVKTLATDAELPTLSPDDRRMAFIRTDPKTFVQDLWVADVNGQSGKAIVLGKTMGNVLYAPRWTPDGEHIVFDAPIRKTSRDDIAPKGWAAWLERLLAVPVASAHDIPPMDLWMVDANGENKQMLLPIAEYEPFGAFSPDGKYFTFIALGGLYVVSADGKDVRWLHRSGGFGRADWKK